MVDLQFGSVRFVPGPEGYEWQVVSRPVTMRSDLIRIPGVSVLSLLLEFDSLTVFAVCGKRVSSVEVVERKRAGRVHKDHEVEKGVRKNGTGWGRVSWASLVVPGCLVWARPAGTGYHLSSMMGYPVASVHPCAGEKRAALVADAFSSSVRH